ncbi:hypothetical protein [Micromonospora chersina]|uniref:hypothetical protein n=1 Tax=Micromonospora chersina TaxID=47854 RepID=UPI0033A2704C
MFRLGVPQGAHEVAEFFDDGDDLRAVEARRAVGVLFDWRVLALFGALALGLGFGDPAGDHGRVGAGGVDVASPGDVRQI